VFKFLTLLATVTAVVLLLFFSLFLRQISFFLLIAAMGAGYGGWYLFTSFNLEYEYIVTNGEMDVDRIIAQKKRKREITVKLADIEIMAPVSEKYKRDYENPNFQKKIDAGSPMSKNAYFLTVRHDKLGFTRLLFEPDDRIINCAKRAAPQKVFTE
ncbi:MAG TPA: hypothetical protein VHR42_02400, partial [Clostridia bacterium]|nr:hypothetical protein [Clostridia bacterium]